MTVLDLKREIASLTPNAQDEIAAYIVHLRNERDPEYSRELERRLNDRDEKNWVRLEDLEAEFAGGRTGDQDRRRSSGRLSRGLRGSGSQDSRRTSQRMKILGISQEVQLSRSRLGSSKVESSAKSHLGIRESLEAVYSRESSDLDPMLEDLQAEALREKW